MTRMDVLALAHESTVDGAALLLSRIAARFHVSVSEIRGNSYKEREKKPRWLACVAFQRLGYSLNMIGRQVNRDHSTVHSALKNAARSPWFAKMAEELTEGIPPLSPYVTALCPVCWDEFQRLRTRRSVQVYCCKRCREKRYKRDRRASLRDPNVGQSAPENRPNDEQ